MKIAIISAVSALLGSLIPQIFGYLTHKKNKEFELKKPILDLQRDSYGDLMSALQNCVNDMSKDKFLVFQKSCLDVFIFGDNKTATISYAYYSSILRGEISKSPLTNEQHKEFHQKILNAIRENFKLGSLDSFELIGFNPPIQK